MIRLSEGFLHPLGDVVVRKTKLRPGILPPKFMFPKVSSHYTCVMMHIRTIAVNDPILSWWKVMLTHISN